MDGREVRLDHILVVVVIRRKTYVEFVPHPVEGQFQRMVVLGPQEGIAHAGTGRVGRYRVGVQLTGIWTGYPGRIGQHPGPIPVYPPDEAGRGKHVETVVKVAVTARAVLLKQGAHLRFPIFAPQTGRGGQRAERAAVSKVKGIYVFVELEMRRRYGFKGRDGRRHPGDTPVVVRIVHRAEVGTHPGFPLVPVPLIGIVHPRREIRIVVAVVRGIDHSVRHEGRGFDGKVLRKLGVGSRMVYLVIHVRFQTAAIVESMAQVRPGGKEIHLAGGIRRAGIRRGRLRVGSCREGTAVDVHLRSAPGVAVSSAVRDLRAGG